MSLQAYWMKWLELGMAPFQHFQLVWLGILPLYVTLLLGELYKSKVSFGHAVGNGFVMLWAGLNWGVHLAGYGWTKYMFETSRGEMQIAWLVTVITVAVGVFTIIIGFRKSDQGLISVLGHTRFSCYFLILLYPLQAHLKHWDTSYIFAILIFGLPAWLLIYLLGRLVRAVIK